MAVALTETVPVCLFTGLHQEDAMSPDRSSTESRHSETARSEAARPGEASGRHQPLRRDDDDKRVRQRLGDVGLSDQGDAFEDEQRDRHSRGAPPEDTNG